MLKKLFDESKRDSLVKYMLNAAILVGVGVATYKYLDLDQLLRAWQQFELIYAPLILVVSTGYLAFKGWRFVLMMRPVTALSWGIPWRAYVAGAAATLIPGGVVARAGLLSQAGVPVEKSATPVLYPSLLDQVVFLLGLFMAAFFVEQARIPAFILFGLLLVFGVLLLIPRLVFALSHPVFGLYPAGHAGKTLRPPGRNRGCGSEHGQLFSYVCLA